MSDKPQVLTRIYDFLLYLIQQVSKFPKNQRYNLGERIENLALDVFEGIVEALYTKEKTYKTGPYQDFVIFEPKRRVISAATYRDRVLHHAIHNILEPIFDRSFIFDSYATRKGK